MKWSRSKLHIGATTAISCVCLLLSAVAIATNHWLEATAVKNEGTTDEATITIYYGLFSGWINATEKSSPYETELKIACHNGKCMYSCAHTSDGRDKDIACYMEHEECTPGDTVDDCTNSQYTIHHNYQPQATTMSPVVRERVFISFASWCVVIFFLVWSVILSLLGVLMGLLNTCSNPSATILATYGLYIWNTGAGVCLVLTMCMWAAMFHGELVDNVVIRETLDKNNFQNHTAHHGYSFLMLLGSLILHMCNLPILYFRNTTEFRQKQEIQPPTEQHIVADNLLY